MCVGTETGTGAGRPEGEALEAAISGSGPAEYSPAALGTLLAGCLAIVERAVPEWEWRQSSLKLRADQTTPPRSNNVLGKTQRSSGDCFGRETATALSLRERVGSCKIEIERDRWKPTRIGDL